ncbi:hypothetical protein [Micromonospora sp. LOL_023]|uniref:hypothetical protein n=1 Tax=Micromonospora sp. LOL_023 TaxID=3345418 RepID=UPI003A864D11
MPFHRQLSPTPAHARRPRTPSTALFLKLLAAAAMLVGAATIAVAAPQTTAGSVPAEATSDPSDMHW